MALDAHIFRRDGPGNPEHGSGSTTGLQDPSPPTTALLYACNTSNSIPDNSAVCVRLPEPVSTPVLSSRMMAAVIGLLLLLGLVSLVRYRRLPSRSGPA